MKIFANAVNFIKEVKIELGKVSWSSRQELLDSTAVVLSSVVLMAVFIGAVDIALSKILTLLFKL